MNHTHKVWAHRWITPKAQTGRSAIHGLGMMAKEPIVSGETVAVYGGIVVPKDQIGEYRNLVGGIRGIQIDDEFFICPTERKGGLFNHSCAPNLGFASALKVVAIRDIEAREELVLDYAFSEAAFEPFQCNCGSPVCREVITADDWKRVCSSSRWGKHCTPFLQEKTAQLCI